MSSSVPSWWTSVCCVIGDHETAPFTLTIYLKFMAAKRLLQPLKLMIA